MNVADPTGLFMLPGKYTNIRKNSPDDPYVTSDGFIMIGPYTVGEAGLENPFLDEGLLIDAALICSGAGIAAVSGRGIIGEVCGNVSKHIPTAFKMYRNALQPFKGQYLTNAGRALTKHPEAIGQTKQAIRQILRTDQAINEAAANALKDIMRNGTRTVQDLPRYGSVVQYQKAGSFGARFSAETGEFIGFINP